MNVIGLPDLQIAFPPGFAGAGIHVKPRGVARCDCHAYAMPSIEYHAG